MCDGLAPGTARGHWSGLEFFNSTHVVVQDQASIKINKSASILEYVDIEFAGVDKHNNPTPAVRAAPLPPRLYNVAVRYSALDGTNFTDVKTSTDVAESTFAGNRGLCQFHPLPFTTSNYYINAKQIRICIIRNSKDIVPKNMCTLW